MVVVVIMAAKENVRQSSVTRPHAEEVGVVGWVKQAWDLVNSRLFQTAAEV